MATTFTEIAEALEDRFARMASGVWSDDGFEDMALGVFRLQYQTCVPYRALCDARGVTPASVARWQDVPMVPAAAFKYFDLVSGGAAPEVVYRTSGTTLGSGARGRHLVPRRSLYRAAALPPLTEALLADVGRIQMASLIPSPAEAPESSLSAMVGMAAEARATRMEWLVDGSGSWTPDANARMRTLTRSGEPVLLFGTALAFVHALAGEAPDALSLDALPEGSRIMETGGFKGARRHVSREELHRALAESTRVPLGRIVNEYGMTELLSQLWEPVLREGPAAAGVHVPAPWLRVRALDPVSLEPLPEGGEGILAFFDLANLGSVAHVLTEDVGSVCEGRVRLRGRVPGSEPRGCSRAMDELMSAAHR